MKNPLPESLPSDIHSAKEGLKLAYLEAKDRLSGIGVYGQGFFVLVATSLGTCFCLILDILLSGQAGAIYFEPIPGVPTSGVFSTNSLIAGVVLSAFTLELASIGKNKSGLLRVIDTWATRFAVLVIFGITALIYSAMSQTLTPQVGSEWGTDVPLLQSILAGFNRGFARPIAENIFIFTFPTLLVCSAFALSKLGHWWFEALRKMVVHATHSGARLDVHRGIKRDRIEYREIAFEFNTGRSSSDKELEESFALELHQTCAAVISELSKAVRRARGDGFPPLDAPDTDLTEDDIKALSEATSYQSILAAVRGKES